MLSICLILKQGTAVGASLSSLQIYPKNMVYIIHFNSSTLRIYSVGFVDFGCFSNINQLWPASCESSQFEEKTSESHSGKKFLNFCQALMNFVVFRISALFLVVQVESNLNVEIFVLTIWESTRFDLDEATGLMLVPPGDAFPPLFRAARCSPTQGHSSPPSPPSLSLSVRNSWLTDLCYHSHCVFVYVSFISFSFFYLLHLFLSFSHCLLLLSISLFLFPSFCTTGCVKFSCGSERVTFKPGGRRTRFLSTPCLALCV